MSAMPHGDQVLAAKWRDVPDQLGSQWLDGKSMAGIVPKNRKNLSLDPQEVRVLIPAATRW